MSDGDLSNLDSNRGVGGSVQGCPGQSEVPPPPPRSWIGIELVDEEGNGINGEKFEVEVPDGTIVRGQTGFGICRPGQTEKRDGRALIQGIPAGTCKLSFIKLDTEAWESA